MNKIQMLLAQAHGLRMKGRAPEALQIEKELDVLLAEYCVVSFIVDYRDAKAIPRRLEHVLLCLKNAQPVPLIELYMIGHEHGLNRLETVQYNKEGDASWYKKHYD